MAPEILERNPYVGPRPFEREDWALFFGRDRETSELLSFVIAHRVVLLYAQSGAGKTSLINAGLIPLLEEEEFQALPLARVSGPISEAIELDEIPNLYAFNTLMSWAEVEADPRRLAQMSLADFLNEREHPTDEEGLLSPRVIIFDQFEELFAFYQERWRDREKFFEQVRDALEGDPLLRLVFVIREDYIAQLDPYAPLLPEGLRTRFRLERLHETAALSAVTEPLKATRRSFAEGAAEKLVEDLLRIRVETSPGQSVEVTGEFVEPVQLQVVCQSLWQDLPPDAIVITPDHLQAFGDVDQALAGFYERSINKTSWETSVREGDLREWFGQILITSSETRGTVHRGREETGRIPNTAVDVLENLHVIRGEWRAGARWYELTHDRFIKPILASNEEWRKTHKNPLTETASEWQRLGRDEGSLFRGKRLAEAAEWAEEHAEEMTLLEEEFLQASMALQAQQLIAMAINSLKEDPERGLLLAVEAVHISHTFEAEDALRRSLLALGIRVTLRGHVGPVWAVAFSSDGCRLATASYDGTARLWDAASGEELAALRHEDSVWAVAFSPDGSRVATCSHDNTARLWDAASGEELAVLLHEGGVSIVTFSPDGSRVATGSHDNTARLWDATSGEELAILSHQGWVHVVAFSPDGSTLATASYDDTARLWDAASGEELAVLHHEGLVDDVAFSPDGRRVATCSHDNTARLWDAVGGEKLAVLRHEDWVKGIAFSPDGGRVATDSQDGAARLFLVCIEDLIEFARSRVSRELTPEEREGHVV